jgi:hypothetical protein
MHVRMTEACRKQPTKKTRSKRDQASSSRQGKYAGDGSTTESGTALGCLEHSSALPPVVSRTRSNFEASNLLRDLL